MEENSSSKMLTDKHIENISWKALAEVGGLLK